MMKNEFTFGILEKVFKKRFPYITNIKENKSLKYELSSDSKTIFFLYVDITIDMIKFSETTGYEIRPYLRLEDKESIMIDEGSNLFSYFIMSVEEDVDMMRTISGELNQLSTNLTKFNLPPLYDGDNIKVQIMIENFKLDASKIPDSFFKSMYE